MNKRTTLSTVDRHKQLTLAVLGQFRVIFGSVRQQFRQIEQKCGITGSQLWVVHVVHDTPGIGVTAVAAKLSIHQSTCSQLVEALVGRGLLKKVRLDEDQRRVGLTLTSLARKVLAKAPGPAEGLLPSALSELSNVSLETLSHQLDKLIAELNLRNKAHARQLLADMLSD
jgi:DNA-binding MarR family transcriptional regulator